VLELRFGPFNRSVIYDPSLGLGVLLGRSEGGGGSSSDTGLIVGAAVAIPVAVVLVVVAIVAGVVFAWYGKKRTRAIDHAVNFEPDENDDQL
jgi:hypothetical protein